MVLKTIASFPNTSQFNVTVIVI